MISMLNVATILNVIQPSINTKTLHNTVLIFLMQNPGTEVTVQAIIISIPAVWFSRHTHTQKTTFCIPSFPSTIKFTFCSVLTYMQRLLTVATLIPAGVDLGQQRFVQFVKVVSGWQI